jgi:hypothetical protein
VKFAVIIPDRRDRPEFTKNCLRQLERMTLKPDRVFHIDHPALGPGFDLIDRVRQGVSLAEQAGFDWCFIIENDDYYPANYFERFANYTFDYSFLGQDYSDYYNLKNLTQNRFQHDYRASLFTTGFRISALNNFTWPENSKPFLDIELWKYARHKKRKFIDTGALGIKHGLGLCGGKGHQMNWPKNYDKDMNDLRKKVDAESFQFYKSMADKLTLQPA